jgi:hypothetical protein
MELDDQTNQTSNEVAGVGVEDQLFDTKQAAEFLGLRPGTLEQYRYRRIGPRYLKSPGTGRRGYMSGLVHYRREDLVAWLVERTRQRRSA